MKTPDPQRQESLSNLLADTFESGGPAIESILERIHAEKIRRESQRRIGFAVGSLVLIVVAIGSGLLRGPGTIEERKDIALVPEPSLRADASGIFFEHVDDEGLLDILAGQPLALVRLPEGQRRLMMLVRNEETVIWSADTTRFPSNRP